MILVFIAGVAAIAAGGFWLGMRWTRRPPPAPDLRRADEAMSQDMPDADEVLDRIGEAFGETRPPGN
ncbi:MAG TPA: hypothetical protein VEM41_01185 [Actinomycetota bacterium]|nr:hypothetical protein [Actinomycetota bacterium]